MRKRDHSIQPIPKLKCPACREYIVIPRLPEQPKFKSQNSEVPQPGQLTDCFRCHAVLEYVSDWDKLALRRAPRWRIRQLDASEPARVPRLSELVDAASKAGKVYNSAVKQRGLSECRDDVSYTK
jgi:hypothetical protein